jgi:hypothetical protein
MAKSVAFLIALGVLSITGYVAGVYALCEIVNHFPSVGPFVFMDTHGSNAFGLRSAILQPAAFMAAMAICLAFDAACVGLDQSSLKRLIESASASTRVDLFYMVMRLAGGINVLIFVFSFGSLIWIINHIHRYLHIGILQYVHSLPLQFAIVFFINTFMGYWTHRMMHTKFMWEIHKVHHAAEEMNLVTTFYVFGTYLPPTNEKLTYGIDDGEAFNRPRYVSEIFDNVRRWVQPLWRRHQPDAANNAPALKVQPSETGVKDSIAA